MKQNRDYGISPSEELGKMATAPLTNTAGGVNATNPETLRGGGLTAK